MIESKLVAEPRTAAFELAGAGLVVTDTAGIILRANQVYAQFLSLSPSELIGTPFTDVFPEDMRESAQRALRGALVPDALPIPSQWSLRRRDGSEMSVLVTVRPTAMPTGRYGAVITLIDISALTATESRLFSAMEEQRLILENAQVGILFTRAQRIMRYNAGFASLFACGDTALIGEPWSVLFKPQERLPAGIPSGTSYHAEHRLQRSDGRQIWCMVEARAFGDDDNAQIIWTFRDTTVEREALGALEAARSDLETRVAERTHDLERKNKELQTQIAERRQIEERLRAHGEKVAFHRNRLLALAERNAPHFAGALKDIAEVSLRTLGLDRVSFWRMHPEQGNVQCEFALRADHQSDPPDAPRQFSAEAHIARFASAAGHHIGEDRDATPTSDAVIRDYMRPLGIVSMLDTPVWLEGQVIGSMSFEMSRPRDWPAEDIDFAAGICTLIALAQEAEQRRDAEAKLRRLAHFDALTSLPNRHLLQDRLKQALAFAQRHRSRVALMFIDLDRFKTINDSLGHLVGDRLLTEVSHRLTASVRAEDSVARLGGDEFVVVLQDLGPVGHAATIAQNLLNAIEPPYLIDGRDLHVSGSIGIALYPDDGQDIETLMRNADTAMYHVKESGRNGFQFFTAEMNAHANALLTMENDLRLALKRGELSLHYQPQYDIASGRIDAIEALLRWRHPQHGLVLPDTFIPLAEESGLIQQLGEWTLNRVCSQTQDWAKNGMAPIPVAINLSARQFRHPAFVTTLTSTLTHHRMDPRMVEIEITESALIKDMDATLDSFRALKAMGIRLAIDDFGTGYSSLAYLKRFPVDKLKIDRSFIRDISEDPDDRAIVSAIISMSKDLELRVVAEGVETAEQLAFLRERGCDGAQGFLFCAPMEADETYRHMADFMRSHRG